MELDLNLLRTETVNGQMILWGTSSDLQQMILDHLGFVKRPRKELVMEEFRLMKAPGAAHRTSRLAKVGYRIRVALQADDQMQCITSH